MKNQAHGLTKAGQETSKNDSNILMEQRLLWLMYYYHSMLSLLFLSYSKNIYFLLSCCYLSYD